MLLFTIFRNHNHIVQTVSLLYAVHVHVFGDLNNDFFAMFFLTKIDIVDCNIFVTGSCGKLLYYPRCLENKVVVLSKPRQLVLLCH